VRNRKSENQFSKTKLGRRKTNTKFAYI